MTLNQLQSLDEQELAMCLFVVNVIDPPGIPKMEFQPRHLTWFRRDALNHKLLQAVPKLLPEAHPIFISLMEKLGVKVEIKKVEPPQPEPTSSICPSPLNENTSSTVPSTNTETELPST